MEYVIPQAALDLEKEFELFRSVAYVDPHGRWTFGFGHTRGVGPGMQVGMDQALRLLHLDTQDACQEVAHLVRVPLDEGQLAALIDFVFNLGPAALAGSTLLHKLNMQDYQGAADELHRWDHIHKVTGEVVENARLRERRCAERDLFLGLERGTSLKELTGEGDDA